MKHLKLLILTMLIAQCLPAMASEGREALNAQKALSELKEGNKRYVEFKLQHPHQDAKRLVETSKAQNPIAVVIACSDSRVSPEILFDQGIGDLFVIRTAGNLLGNNEIASIEYALSHLHTHLVVVLGHTECGAIKAVVEKDGLTSHLAKALCEIKAAQKEAIKHTGQDLADETMRVHVQNEVNALKKSKPVIKDKFDNSEVEIKGAVYDVKTGRVEFLK